MTKYSYETASRLFDEHGYSTTCEFMRISDTKRGKFLSRCRVCGYEFERYNNILRKPQKNLRCPKCHDRLITAALEYYQAGHSRDECAEKFGLTPWQIQNYAASRGVHGGMSKEQLGEFAKESQTRAAKASAKAKHERAVVRNNEKRIVAGFKGIENDVNDWRKSVESLAKDSERALCELEKLNEWIAGEYSSHKRHLVEYEPQIATCRHCGDEWLFWPSHEKYGRKKPSPYCSRSCLNRHTKRKSRERYGVDNIGRRLKRYGADKAPRDHITLDALIERDGGVCYLCGCTTSKADSWHDENGNFICGETYPTRDHVMPIAKGGTHTWDNVKLACMKCNSTKGATILGSV